MYTGTVLEVTASLRTESATILTCTILRHAHIERVELVVVQRGLFERLPEEVRHEAGPVPVARPLARLLAQRDECVNGKRTVAGRLVAEPLDYLAVIHDLDEVVPRERLLVGVPSPI